MEVYKFNGGEFEVFDKNIILIKYDKVKSVTVRVLFEQIQLRKKVIGENTKFHAILDMTNGLLNLSEEAKLFLAEENEVSNLRISDVALVDSFAKRIEAELYIQLNKPVVPTKIFTDLDKAISWCRERELARKSPIK